MCAIQLIGNFLIRDRQLILLYFLIVLSENMSIKHFPMEMTLPINKYYTLMRYLSA